MNHSFTNPMQKLKLLDGTFSAEEAAVVLLSLVKSKIEFHSKEKFSNEVRFGRDLSGSESRLAELRQLHETLSTLCQRAAHDGRQLRVSGWLDIELVTAPAGQTASVTTRAVASSEVALV